MHVSVTIPKDRGGRRAAAPARDGFLSSAQGFYTWFNMLPVEFASILHSGLPHHSHFKSNCWNGCITWEKCAKKYIPAFKSSAFLTAEIYVNGLWHSLSKQAIPWMTHFHSQPRHWCVFSHILIHHSVSGRLGAFYKDVRSFTFACWCCVLAF